MMSENDEDTVPAVAPQPREISQRTLRMIDKAAENLGRGIVGPPVDLERLKRLAS
jgi:hypothetical protein